ncbi:MAG TPA: hypothetical protein VGQ41_03935 [Pyrinomonadaceae bacterium]|jgi:hypothetical protein|nr:hypothetical protein [Pyrinomonadaceae bacterium]
MAGTNFTSGFDVVIQINARNFESLVEQRIRPLLSLLGSLGLEQPPGTAIGLLTFTGAPSVRFFVAGASGLRFDLELVLENASYALTGQMPTSTGTGRSTITIPATIQRISWPSPPPPPPPDPGQIYINLALNFDWSSVTYVPFDNAALLSSGVSSTTVARQVANALLTLLGPQIVLLGMAGIPLIIDGRPDPVGMLLMRDFQPTIIRTTPSSSNVDVFAFGVSLLAGGTGNAAGLQSATGPLDEGTITISNSLIFNRVISSLSQSPPTGLGVSPGNFSITPASAPNTLSINSGTRTTVNGTSLRITNFTLVAAANSLTLTSHFQFEILPPGVEFEVDVNGPVSFALTRGGALIAGAVLTNSVTYHVSVAGGVLIVLAAAFAAILTVATYGTATAPVVAIGAGTVATAVIIGSTFVNMLVGEIGRLLGPTFQTSIESAFSGAGAGGLVPPSLLSLLGGSVSFTPPLVFDDFNVGASFPGISAVAEFRRVDAIHLEPGSAIDLDTNSISSAWTSSVAPGIDLLWAADGYPVLRAQTGAKLIRLSRNFDDLLEPQLERLVVGITQSIDGTSIPVVPPSGTIPEPVVIGMITNERRYAKVAVWKDRYGRLILRYVIYDNLAPNIRIQAPRPVWQVVRSVRMADTPGTWLTPPRRNSRVSNQGSFRTLCHRMMAPVNYDWSLAGASIAGSGATVVSGSPVTFIARGDSCALTTDLGANLDAELACTARDAAGTELVARLQLVAQGVQSTPYGHSGLESRLDVFNQLVITRIEDIRPDPPPDELIRVERDRIEVLTSIPGNELNPATAVTSISLADATTSLSNAIRANGGPNLPDLRLR